MRINKDETHKKLNLPILELSEVVIKFPKYGVLLTQIRLEEIRELYKTSDNTGIYPRILYKTPWCVAFDRVNNQIWIYPKADKRYTLRVIGTQLIEQ